MSNSLPFHSADKAAVYALSHQLETSIKDKWEYGGYIFRIGTKYFYDVPLKKSSEPEGGTMAPVPTLPRGATLVATMHTHPFDRDFYAEEGNISTITKPARFSVDKDVPGRRNFETAWQANHSAGPIDMYVIDIHGEVAVLEGKRGTRAERERVVRPATDLTGI